MGIQDKVVFLLSVDGMTQAKLASLVGYSQSGVERLKRGIVPSFYKVSKEIERLYESFSENVDIKSIEKK